MQSSIAILTYNRLDALKTCLAGIKEHCPNYRVAIFEDGGFCDNTRAFLLNLAGNRPCPKSWHAELDAVGYGDDRFQVFLASHNRGVAANSNRALRWFMEETLDDHLCLCNDDILVKGDFVATYAKAHEETGIGQLCLCPFDSEQYRGPEVPYRGWNVKILPRMTGMMISEPRKLIQTIGFFDTRFGKFGQEHCDRTNRARFAGFVQMDGQPQWCLDIAQDDVTFQDVETSVQGPARAAADAHANAMMEHVSSRYKAEHFFRPYRLFTPDVTASVGGAGIQYSHLAHLDHVLDPID